jgi:hypothetical protein
MRKMILRHSAGERRLTGREHDLDVQAAQPARPRAQFRIVRRGDGGHDRQPQAQTILAGAAHDRHPLERLEEPAELIGRYHRPAVANREERAAATHSGADLQPATRLVVPDRVVEKVGDQAFG